MEIYGANPVDIIVLIILLVSGLLALVRGFVSEVLTLVGLCIAVAVSLYFLPAVLPTALDYAGMFTDKKELATLIAKAGGATVLFFSTLVVTSFITYLLSRKIQKSNLSAIDRSLGFLFGLLRGGIIATLLFIAVTAVFVPPKPGEDPAPGTVQAVLKEARATPALAGFSRVLMSFAPKDGLSIEDLTSKVEPLSELMQPKPEVRPQRNEENRGYSTPARQGIEDVINRSTQEQDGNNGQ